MELSEQERERIRQEESFRAQLRKEMKLRQLPRLILLAILWTIILSVLALVGPHLPH